MFSVNSKILSLDHLNSNYRPPPLAKMALKIGAVGLISFCEVVVWSPEVQYPYLGNIASLILGIAARRSGIFLS